MEERQVSQDGQTRRLPDPFFVIATQNPVEQIGAYPLPESQLDRFLMAIELGYPDAAAERDLLSGGDRRAPHWRNDAARRPGDAGRLAARGRRYPRRAGLARLRAGAARGIARPHGQRDQRRCRRAAWLEPARGSHVDCRCAGVCDDRVARDGVAGGCTGGVSVGRRATGWPAARARARCRRRRSCAPCRCRSVRQKSRAWPPRC